MDKISWRVKRPQTAAEVAKAHIPEMLEEPGSSLRFYFSSKTKYKACSAPWTLNEQKNEGKGSFDAISDH